MNVADLASKQALVGFREYSEVRVSLRQFKASERSRKFVKCATLGIIRTVKSKCYVYMYCWRRSINLSGAWTQKLTDVIASIPRYTDIQV
jgi:hypothetical protein